MVRIKVLVDADFCGGCETCIDRCPQKCIKMVYPEKKSTTKVALVDQTKCTGCGVCKEACANNAISLHT